MWRDNLRVWTYQGQENTLDSCATNTEKSSACHQLGWWNSKKEKILWSKETELHIQLVLPKLSSLSLSGSPTKGLAGGLVKPVRGFKCVISFCCVLITVFTWCQHEGFSPPFNIRGKKSLSWNKMWGGGGRQLLQLCFSSQAWLGARATAAASATPAVCHNQIK